MSRYRIAQRARDDLDEIWDYIRQDNPTAADRQIDLLVDQFSRLAANPGIGQLREDLRPNLRVFPVGSYVIFYYPSDEGIEVIGVIHGARDILGLFRRHER